jgi:hypothetical protein
MAFQTKITRARFAVGPFSSEQMQQIGQVVLDSIITRIQKGVNALDQPAKPLKPGRNGKKGYPDYKIARGLQPIRDWTLRGKTMRALKVKSANENRVVLGFLDPQSDAIAHFNNLRERAFAVSPNDQKVFAAAVTAMAKEQRVVRVVRAA